MPTCSARPTLAADPRFATNQLRCEHEPELRAALEERLAAAPVAAWLARLEAADLPGAPINDVAAVLAHPQVLARNMVVPVDDPALPGFRVAGNPIKLSTQDDPPSRPAAPAARRRPRPPPRRARPRGARAASSVGHEWRPARVVGA